MNITKFIILNLYFLNIQFNNNKIFIKIFIKMYFIKRLKINMLIEMNIFTFLKIRLNHIIQFAIIINYQNFNLFIKFEIKSYLQIK